MSALEFRGGDTQNLSGTWMGVGSNSGEATPPNLDERLSLLRRPHPDPNCEYYAITLLADDDSKIHISYVSHWIGWTDESRRYEVRAPSLIDANFVRAWEKLSQPYCIIINESDIILFMLGGGNALIERSIAEKFFPRPLKPGPVAFAGEFGFQGIDSFEPTAFRRAPTPKLRMQVLNRDKRRCRICGRRPDDYIDLELHVHHIRPWEKGGLTSEENLITLCQTCHNGLYPHGDHTLFQYLADCPENPVRAATAKFTRGVENFRKIGFANSERVQTSAKGGRLRKNSKGAL